MQTWERSISYVAAVCSFRVKGAKVVQEAINRSKLVSWMNVGGVTFQSAKNWHAAAVKTASRSLPIYFLRRGLTPEGRKLSHASPAGQVTTKSPKNMNMKQQRNFWGFLPVHRLLVDACGCSVANTACQAVKKVWSRGLQSFPLQNKALNFKNIL